MDPLIFFRRVPCSTDQALPEGSRESEVIQWGKHAECYYSDTDQVTKSSVLWFRGGPHEWYPGLSKQAWSSGRHFWEFHVACDNMWVGVATPNVSMVRPLGTDGEAWACDLQTGDCFTSASYDAEGQCPRRTGGLVGRLTKLIVPVAGGRVGLYLDCDEGCLALFFNSEYQGLVVADGSLKGKTLHAAAGIGGLEGKRIACPAMTCFLPPVHPYKRNKI
eukprot:TRINITY_DN293_c0_g1_i1.p1 TRINITY_DN293_c0_g1~~TRINITY_DN293_c0_g1_i1.p1  ORF type:complete len:219 (+),score=17.35 TRINITY_DN293_c0_g1_i1:106-762(+)